MAKAPTIGIVSLGCPKALVDSERILTRLRSEGYQLSGSYEGADLVVVNTCGFLDSAKAESLEAIGEALNENGKVIVTGCLGKEEELIRGAHPNVLAVTGPHQYEAVVSAVHAHLPPQHDPKLDLVPESGLRLTPRHYAYLKISEGCNNRCSFCIIPSIRGDLVSRPANAVLKEAESLVKAGVKEILVISQDTSAYGVDVKYAESKWKDRMVRAKFYDLAKELGELGVWVRLHYVYPYPHVDEVIPLMAEGKILPYLDIPFQHASPRLLRAMRRPANQDRTLERIAQWRSICPDLTIRSSFIVGFPGETEEEFETLLDFIEEAGIDRAGCFKYENVEGAASREIDDQIEQDVIDERYERFMETQTALAYARGDALVGATQTVIIDGFDENTRAYEGRTKADAPEIDGIVRVFGTGLLQPGDILDVRISAAEGHELTAEAA
ncbi:MAG: 30S ribosomal protein S12 methylthiotransferase RimO [Hydrogenophilaceae bacterium]|jgi:ribosomal protein S12 methylthiotransferase|nr:30S ribosomal protein S12 methylthiotransferase RimO [Hydrogenophilaceae bacterium]